MMRAESAAWLWFSYTTLPQAVSHTNALLRELALGGEAAHEAALLLLSHLPAETKTLLGRGVPVSHSIVALHADRQCQGCRPLQTLSARYQHSKDISILIISICGEWL